MIFFSLRKGRKLECTWKLFQSEQTGDDFIEENGAVIKLLQGKHKLRALAGESNCKIEIGVKKIKFDEATFQTASNGLMAMHITTEIA